MKESARLLEALAWQVEAGATEALDQTPGLARWGASFAPPLSSASPAQAAAPPPQRPPAAEREGSGILSRPMPTATSLDDLKGEIGRFEGCSLKRTAMSLVFSSGNPKARLMVIGDVPSEDDDRQGEAFRGSCGNLLDAMLASIGQSRQTVYLTHLLFWRPPGNRAPSEEEIEACLPFAERHIALADPAWLIVLGGVATRALLRSKEPFSQKRGKWTRYTPRTGPLTQDKTIACFPMYHPSYLLRQPDAKRHAWEDLLRLRQEINSTIIVPDTVG